MKKILLCLLLSPSILTAQRVINVEYPAQGSIVYSKKTSFPKINSGFTLWLPKEASKGVIVFFDAYRDTVNKTPIIDLALKNQLAMLFVTTNNQLEFLFDVKTKETHRAVVLPVRAADPSNIGEL